MTGRMRAVLACCAALAAGACEEARSMEIEPLPPERRPSPEERAGLPVVAGTWRFAGFEIRAADTAAVNNQVYRLVPPGELRVATQRLDSVAGQYVREGTAFPFVGEVRRDSVMTLVAFSGGVGQFAAGRVAGDTFWIEMTSFGSAEAWPPGARAAMVRGRVGQPFQRLLGGRPITVPVDSAAIMDSLRLDSLRAAVPPPAEAQPQPRRPTTTVPAAPTPERPAAEPEPQRRPPAARPQAPPRQQPRPTPPPAREPEREPDPEPPPRQPEPEPVRPEPEPVRPEPEPARPPPVAPPPVAAPRDTIRFGNPPR